MATDREANDQRRGDQRPDGGRRAQQAEAGRPHVEDVLREDREQRDGTAQQHGEEVERDRAEQDVRPPDEPNAREHLVHACGALGRRRPPAAHREHARERHDRQDDRDDVDELGLDREQETSERRRDDGRHLEADRPLRERAHEDLLGNERRRERTARGRTDGAADALQEREREERPHAFGAREVTASRPPRTTKFIEIITASSVRRGTRSASCPAGSAKRRSGRNSASPTSPRSSGFSRTE